MGKYRIPAIFWVLAAWDSWSAYKKGGVEGLAKNTVENFILDRITFGLGSKVK